MVEPSADGVGGAEGRVLVSLDERPNLLGYLRQLTRARDLTLSMVRNDLRNRNGTLVLGWAWNILDPLLMLGLYWLIFGLILAGRRPENFLAYLAVGLFLFRFVQGTIVAGSASLSRNLGMIRHVRFPRAVLPIAEMLRQLTMLYWQLPVVLLIVVATSGRPRTAWLVYLGVLVPLTATFALGWALLLARISTVFVDVTKVLPYFFRIVFYASGVLFPIDAYLEGQAIGEWLPVNPVYTFITLARHLTLRPVEGAPLLWVSAVSWALVSLVVGLRVFLGGEHRYGRG